MSSSHLILIFTAIVAFGLFDIAMKSLKILDLYFKNKSSRNK